MQRLGQVGKIKEVEVVVSVSRASLQVGTHEAELVEETVATGRPGAPPPARRVLARYRLLASAEANLRSRMAQMEARLSALCGQAGRSEGCPEVHSLQVMVEALRAERGQIVAELSRLSAALSELR